MAENLDLALEYLRIGWLPGPLQWAGTPGDLKRAPVQWGKAHGGPGPRVVQGMAPRQPRYHHGGGIRADRPGPRRARCPSPPPIGWGGFPRRRHPDEQDRQGPPHLPQAYTQESAQRGPAPPPGGERGRRQGGWRLLRSPAEHPRLRAEVRVDCVAPDSLARVPAGRPPADLRAWQGPGAPGT